MKQLCAKMLLALLVISLWRAAGQTPSDKTVPSIDKQEVENYLRFAEGFAANVHFSIDDPQPTPLAGYYRLAVHLSMGDTRQDKLYYVTADGKHIINGVIWDLKASPFAETAGKIPTDGPSFGPPDAKITLVVFSDFQCPFCREFARVLRENVPQKYPQDVRVVFKDFPLESIHPWAESAAEAGRCIARAKPDAFWLFHDWIFQHQGELTSANLQEKVRAFAREQKLDETAIASCLATHATKDEVDAAVKQGKLLAIEQTPTFFLNGRPVPGSLKWPSLNTLIQMELSRPAGIPAGRPGK